MGQLNKPQGGNPKTVNRTLLVVFVIVGITQVALLFFGFNFPFQIISIILNLVGVFFTIPQSMLSQFPNIRSLINKVPRKVNIIIPLVLLILLLLSLGVNYYLRLTPTSCPYQTRRDYADNLQNIQMNVDVPQGCYMLMSIYSGYYIAPDNINITQGSLLAFEGPVSISAFLAGGGGGFAGFSDEASAKAFYCYALHSNNVYSIQKTAHSLDFASKC